MPRKNNLSTEHCDIKVAELVLDKKIEALQSVKNTLNEIFIEIIDTFYNAKGRLILTGIGKSGHVARKVSATFASTGAPSLFIHPSEAGHGDLGMISNNDIVILLSNSGQTVELIPIINYCQRFSIKTIGITCNPESMLANSVNLKLILPAVEEACGHVPAPTTSTTAMIAIGDALAVALYKRRDFSALDFRIFHPGGNLGARLLTLAELMLVGENIPLVSYNSGVKLAIAEMNKKGLGCVGVVDNKNNLIGMVTDGDLRRNLFKISDDCDITEIMTKNPITLASNAFAQEAMALISAKKITNIFITDKEKPIGIIHLHQLLRAGVL
jgi:arabinose-5-phosphate isomerase